MRIGTKSVLVGAHQFLLHPLLIAIGWWKEYGVGPVVIGERRVLVSLTGSPLFASYLTFKVRTCLFDPRLWIAFVVHDMGYLGKPNMDGPEGETHPEFGARLMRSRFGDAWGDFVLLHSRYYAKRLNRPVSPLCAADKWVIVLEPSWLYLPRTWLSGELREYVANGMERARRQDEPFSPQERAAYLSGSALRWHWAVKSFMRRWIAEQRTSAADTWTPARHAATTGGVE